MNSYKKSNALIGLLVAACTFSASALGADSSAVAVDQATLARIRDAALNSDFAYLRLTELTDRIGPRLSGSPGAAAAVALIADDMRNIGMQSACNRSKCRIGYAASRRVSWWNILAGPLACRNAWF